MVFIHERQDAGFFFCFLVCHVGGRYERAVGYGLITV